MVTSQFYFGMELTLLTINTWKCDGDYYNRREALKRGLKEAGANIILCQECFRSACGEVDTLAWLAQELALGAHFVPMRRKQRLLAGEWTDSYSGLGVLTALPILERAVIDLPCDPADGERKAQLLTLELSTEISLLIANIHLTHLDNEDLRRRQLRPVIEALRKSALPLRMIGGDWNATADSTVLQEIMVTTPATDCYIPGGGPEPRCSLLTPYLEGRAVCVDHILALPFPGRLVYPQFERAGVVLDRPDAVNGLYPSDHFGIRVTLV